MKSDVTTDNIVKIIYDIIDNIDNKIVDANTNKSVEIKG